MVASAWRDSAVWRVIACHLDTAEKRELLSYLAQAPDTLHSLGELGAQVRSDQLTLLACLADLQAAGLVQAVRRPDGCYYGASRAPRVRALLDSLPEYYARLHR